MRRFRIYPKSPLSFAIIALLMVFYMHNICMDTYVYSIEDEADDVKTLYVNLTNKCSNACVFCIRNTVDDIKGKNLWLENEDVKTQDVITQLNNFNKPEEVVFCGFGEPFMKLDVLKEVASYLKEQNIKVRVNTNGIGNVVNKKNIVPEISNLVDEISISLNAPTEEQYAEISKPKIQNAYNEMIDFAKKSVENGIKTTLSVVNQHPDYTLDIQACEKIADEIGADLKVRKWLNNGY